MPTSLVSDEHFMDEALKLAKKAMGWTNPNPMVGAIIVKNGKIIGKGYHRKVGSPHAEIEALKAAKTSFKGATLYVNLEPCTYYSRTPPCTDAIIKSGIKRVVCATADPNSKVSGQGITQMQAAGVEVSVGTRSKEARSLNEAFFTFHEKQRPFTAIKFAASLDGKLATYESDSQWITNEEARAFARSLRAEYQAILIGIKTVIHDDPHLGVRLPGKKDPLRIILDSKLGIPLHSQVLRDNNVLIATTPQAPNAKKKLLQQKGATILTFEGDSVPVSKLLEALVKQEIISILVEGGGETLGSFIDEKITDKVYAFYAPLLVGGAKAVTIRGKGSKTIQDATYLREISVRNFQDNFMVTGYT